MNVAQSPPQRDHFRVSGWDSHSHGMSRGAALHTKHRTFLFSSPTRAAGASQGWKVKNQGWGWGAPGFLSQVEGTLTGLLLFLKPAGATPHPKPCHHQHCPVSAEGTHPLEPRGWSDNLLGGLWLRASY